MRFSVAAAAATLLSVASVQAAEHVVKVGANSELIFDPSEIDNAAVGDTIAFQFQGKNHSVTQSSFAAPCTPLAGGANSGFQPVANGSATLPQFSFNITNATTPVWFFCAQTTPISHCGNGMVFALNPTAAKTFTAFQAAANATLTGSSTNGTSSTGASATGATATGATATGATATGGASAGSASSPAGTATAPATSTTAAASGALKFGGSAAGVMSVAALLIGFAL